MIDPQNKLLKVPYILEKDLDLNVELITLIILVNILV